MSEMALGDSIVAQSAASVEIIEKETGTVLSSIPIEPGIHSANTFLEFAGEGQALELVNAYVQPRAPRASVMFLSMEDQFGSAANPSFRVTAQDRQARKLERDSARLEAAVRRAEAVATRVQRAVDSVDPEVQAQREAEQAERIAQAEADEAEAQEALDRALQDKADKAAARLKAAAEA